MLGRGMLLGMGQPPVHWGVEGVFSIGLGFIFCKAQWDF